jgi:hypothetical protein
MSVRLAGMLSQQTGFGEVATHALRWLYILWGKWLNIRQINGMNVLWHIYGLSLPCFFHFLYCSAMQVAWHLFRVYVVRLYVRTSASITQIFLALFFSSGKRILGAHVKIGHYIFLVSAFPFTVHNNRSTSSERRSVMVRVPASNAVLQKLGHTDNSPTVCLLNIQSEKYICACRDECKGSIKNN